MTTALPQDVIARALGGASMEWYLTDECAFGLTTASPLQRACARIVDGMPLGSLAFERTVVSAIGDVESLPSVPPREVGIFSGIRTGKSLFAACAAVKMALSCDVSKLRIGEIPRVSVLSLTKDLADVIFGHVVGGIERSPLLRSRLMKTSELPNGVGAADSVFLRHPSGLPVEIKVVAGSRAGASLVARWSAGCIFDEAPRMLGGDEGVVNWQDSRDAVLLRLLPGAQVYHVGSPYAPFGPIYEMVQAHRGKPTEHLVIVKAPAPAFNPVWWTPERVAEARAADPDAARTDVDAEFKSPEEAMFSMESIDRATRSAPVIVPRKQGCVYYAAMDPATRGNGWTLAIATRDGGKTVVVRAEEWVGSREEPLDPGDVLGDIATVCAEYGVTTVHSDQVMGDALIKLGRQNGINIAQWRYVERERAEKYLSIRTRLDAGEIELPPTPKMRTDLMHIRKRVTPTGMGIVLPMTSDGRHCDWGPTLMLVLTRLLPDPEVAAKPTVDDETLRLRKQLQDRMKKKRDW